ncbi:LrgB family protein [Paradevosia shaoguanensis]|jgi:predicted murein hydrolase (TIGR00659 family)|uniref:LrgB family protein n=1 Tax=Paradevosia shaoguanensis TaxID=1335043 RepID=A0AA41QTR1_9HYPH|nr:LrgB family protein [Paradevosia shaoguanensis]KFL25821.1 membrane protein [Devosia sp. 17-2-E-8]MCF1744988.1 LrgB family protein [Paradevosia shaoguanensis]MCI0129471.1 LrgB family protein [Paradevosia shaoguanensis]CDP53378.1 LrgA-associated membrane protein LrgB [Devosia sp. DBB001]
MNQEPFSLWVYLSSQPLLWLVVTLWAWVAADRIALLARRAPIVNPVLIAILIVSAILAATNTPYAVYFEGAQFVHFLLGAATVSIAIPLVRNRSVVRANLLPLLAALIVGSMVAIISVIVLGRIFGLPHDVLVAMAPKSVTAPVAMGIAEKLGGEPSLTAVLVILTGVLGAVVVTPLMNAFRIRDYAARGFAVGLASHGIGTARAFVVDPLAGTFAGIAMGLNAILTSILTPILVHWLL